MATTVMWPLVILLKETKLFSVWLIAHSAAEGQTILADLLESGTPLAVLQYQTVKVLVGASSETEEPVWCD